MSEALVVAKVEETLLELGLKRASEVLYASLEWASGRQATYAEFLQRLLDVELEERHNRYLQTRLRLSNFPYQKTLSDFDFSFQPSIDERQIRELATLSFVEEGGNIISLGREAWERPIWPLGMEAVSRCISVYL